PFGSPTPSSSSSHRPRGRRWPALASADGPTSLLSLRSVRTRPSSWTCSGAWDAPSCGFRDPVPQAADLDLGEHVRDRLWLLPKKQAPPPWNDAHRRRVPVSDYRDVVIFQEHIAEVLDVNR